MLDRALAERLYDYAERIFVTALGVGVVMRFWPTIHDNPLNLLLVVSECAAVLMIALRRRAQHTDLSPYAITIALVGTTGALLVKPGGATLIPPILGASFMAAGLLLN